MTWSAVAYSGKSWDGERFERFVEWKIDDMLDEVDASDDQRTQVRAIATAAIADMGEFRDFRRAGREALVDALTQETVDREALEALRQSKLETADRASQRLLTALADAAEVLTPAQRTALAAELESRDWHHRRLGATERVIPTRPRHRSRTGRDRFATPS